MSHPNEPSIESAKPQNSATVSGHDVLAAAGLCAFLFIFSGTWFGAMGDTGIAVAQFVGFALPALGLGFCRKSGFAWLGMRAPSLRSLWAAVLLGGSVWYWNVHCIAPIGAGWSPPQNAVEWSQQVAVSTRALWATLLLFAVVPAICEELLHRGVLVPAFAARLGTWPAILVSSVIFGFSHLDLARFLPTSVLGGFAAHLRLRSGSLWPPMVLHCLYNSCLLIAAAGDWELPVDYVVASALVSVIGVRLTTHSPPHLSKQ